MLAIAAHGRPGGLERQQKQEEKHEGLARSRSLPEHNEGQSDAVTRSLDRRRRSPFATTSRLAPMSANTAIRHGGLAEECQHHEDSFDTDRQRYVLPEDRVRALRQSDRLGIRRRSSFMTTTSAASMAVSVLVPPIANPMSAFARAGASLIPSPVIGRRTVLFLHRINGVEFALRQFARASLIPGPATVEAVAALSPVSMTGVTPSPRAPRRLAWTTALIKCRRQRKFLMTALSSPAS